MAETSSTEEADPKLLHYADSQRVKPTSLELGVFSIVRRSSSLDVFLDGRGNLGIPGATIRVYRSVGGIEYEIARRVLRNVSAHFRGHVLSVQGVGAYRVTIQGGAGVSSADVAEAVLSFQAWGATGESPPGFPALDPLLEPEWVAASRFAFNVADPEAQVLPLFGPSFAKMLYLRQVWGTLIAIASNARYIQFWDNGTSDTLSTLLYEAYISAVGDGFSADFRDVHRAAIGNDGYRTRAWATATGCAPSVTVSPVSGVANVFTGTVTLTIFSEIRRSI